jgi:hypothetical protein
VIVPSLLFVKQPGYVHSLRPIALATGLFLGLSITRADVSLTADDIMQKAANASQRAALDSRPDYGYNKFTVTEEFDGAGRLKEHKEKNYDVLMRGGLSYLRLTRINGSKLAGGELKKQEDLEVANRRKMTLIGENGRGDNREHFLTTELVAKYNFTLLGEEDVNGRPAFLLTFRPKTPSPAIKHVTDRLLNQLSGKVWIDESEFQIAKAEVHLQTQVNLCYGLLGSLSKLSFTLERARVADGVWYNKSSLGDFEGRKLLEPTRIKTKSESSNFRRLASVSSTF